MDADRIASLTDSQRTYLRLVLAHRSSKEIAQQFGISAHTVDKRIKEAMRILSVSSRIDAARILSQAEQSGQVQGLGPQSPDLVSSVDSRPDQPSAAEGSDRGEFVTQDRHNAGLRLEDGASLPLPFPLFARPRRKLSLWQRAGWVIGLIIGLALATGIFLSALIAVSALVGPIQN